MLAENQLRKKEEPKVHDLALEAAVNDTQSRVELFEVNGFLGLGAQPIHKIAIRVARKDEEFAALGAAHAFVVKVAGGIEAAARDEDIVRDAKVIEILFRVCRKWDDPKYPAFAGPEWMRKSLTTDQLAALMNLVTEVRAKSGPGPSEIDDITVEAALDLAAKYSDTDAPDKALARMSREYLTQLTVLAALKLRDAREAASEAVCLSGFLRLLEMVRVQD